MIAKYIVILFNGRIEFCKKFFYLDKTTKILCLQKDI